MRYGSTEFEHKLCNQVAIVVGYCELLLDALPADSVLRPDLLEMQKAAAVALAMLQSTAPPNP